MFIWEKLDLFTVVRKLAAVDEKIDEEIQATESCYECTFSSK